MSGLQFRSTRRLLAGTSCAIAVAVLAATLSQPLHLEAQARQTGFRFEVSFPSTLEAGPLDGRVLLVVARSDKPEARFQVGPGLRSQPLFGVDVEALRPGQPAIVDPATRGWPLESIRQIPPGDYVVQAVLNVYTTFTRADGHTIKAHMDQWEGQRWNQSPGNLVSEPQKVHVDPGSSTPVRIALTRRLPPIDPPEDTKFVKHVKFRSDILSRWWGRDVFLGAIVILPEGFDEHPNARYPVAYDHGHFQRSARAEAFRFQQQGVPGALGHFLIVIMQHPTPFYDDSYAVNSANNGPYGDGLTQELIPRVEKQFRAIGEPWARTLFGGSTGGWESLAWQVFYPDLFNGTWTFCPDPVDFRYFQLVNIYQDRNAFYPNGDWKTEPVRPSVRGVDDQVQMSQKDMSHYEQVLGTRGRSGEQMDIFMATFGPVGPDGYPRLLYDKWTGEIDREVAGYWREHYDLTHILERDWKTLGPKLVGKLHLYVGDTDTYFLEEAAFLLQRFLESTKDPYYAGSFDIGRRQPHCYAGMPEFPGQTVSQRVLPQMVERILRTAPPGADVTSWRY
jgi:hypothetical protein